MPTERVIHLAQLTTAQIKERIAPILAKTYGDSPMCDGLADHLAEHLLAFAPGEKRRRMVMNICWDWFSGGTTAEFVAGEIEEALS